MAHHVLKISLHTYMQLSILQVCISIIPLSKLSTSYAQEIKHEQLFIYSKDLSPIAPEF